MKRRIVFLTGAFAALATVALAQDDMPRPSGIHMGTKTRQFLIEKITVADMQRSLDFYGMIGLKAAGPRADKPIDPNAAFSELPLSFNGSLADPFLTLVTQKGIKPDRATAKLVWVSIKIPDVRATVARLKAAGFEVDREPPPPGPGNIYGMVRDPDGYVVELIGAPSVE